MNCNELSASLAKNITINITIFANIAFTIKINVKVQMTKKKLIMNEINKRNGITKRKNYFARNISLIKINNR